MTMPPQNVSEIPEATTTPSSSYLVTPETLIISIERENSSHDETLQQGLQSYHSLSFILVPILFILGVAICSGVAIYCIQRRKRLDNLRHTLIPLYTFNKEDDEWGVLLDNCNCDGDQNQKARTRYN